jgi:hypothetical protein
MLAWLCGLGRGIRWAAVLFLLLIGKAELRAQFDNSIPSPKTGFMVMNAGEGGDRHFEICDGKVQTVLSAMDQQFRQEPVSRAALEARWSPDGKLVAISISLGASEVDTCVYALRGESFIPVALEAFQPGHKVAPICWLGPRDLEVTVDGPYPAAGDRPVFGRTCTYRFRPEKSQFEKVYESRAARLAPVKLLVCLESATEADRDVQKYMLRLLRKLGEDKFPRYRTYHRWRDCRVLMSGPKAEAALASLIASTRIPGGPRLGIFGLPTMIFVDGHGRAQWFIDSTDAPRAGLNRADGDAQFIWFRDDPEENEYHIAREFYRQVLPELRRVTPAAIEQVESYFSKGGLDKRIETWGHDIP